MPRNLQELTDEQLFERITPRPWEARYERMLWSGAGCSSAIAILVVSSVVGIWMLLNSIHFWGEITFILFTLFAVGAGSWLVVNIPRFRCRGAWRELMWRYGGGPLSKYVHDCRKVLAVERYDAVVLVQAGSAPITVVSLTRAYLRWTGEGHVDTRSTDWMAGPGSGDWFGSAGQRNFSAVDIKRLRGLIESRRAEKFRLDSVVIDGTLVSMIVLRGDGTSESLEFNNCGVDEDSSHPLVQLVRTLWSMSADAPSREVSWRSKR